MNVLTQQKKHTVETLLGRGAHGRGGFDGDHVVAMLGKPSGIPTRTGPDIEDATCSIGQQVDQTAMHVLGPQALVLVGEIVGVVVVEHSGGVYMGRHWFQSRRTVGWTWRSGPRWAWNRRSG